VLVAVEITGAVFCGVTVEVLVGPAVGTVCHEKPPHTIFRGARIIKNPIMNMRNKVNKFFLDMCPPGNVILPY